MARTLLGKGLVPEPAKPASPALKLALLRGLQPKLKSKGFDAGHAYSLWSIDKVGKPCGTCRAILPRPERRGLPRILIKTGLGRADFSVDARQLRRGLLSNGYRELPVSGEHAIEVGSLPDVHKDPFDRILIAQSRVEGMRLVTADKLVAQYSGDILLV